MVKSKCVLYLEERFLMKAIEMPYYEKPSEPLIKWQWHKWQEKTSRTLLQKTLHGC